MITPHNIKSLNIIDIFQIYIATDSIPVDMATYELCCDMIDVTIDISSIYGHRNEKTCSSGFDQNSFAVVTLKTHQIIFIRQINTYLALVSVIKADNFEKQGLIDFNFNVFKKVNFLYINYHWLINFIKGVEDVFELGKRRYCIDGTT